MPPGTRGTGSSPEPSSPRLSSLRSNCGISEPYQDRRRAAADLFDRAGQTIASGRLMELPFRTVTTSFGSRWCDFEWTDRRRTAQRSCNSKVPIRPHAKETDPSTTSRDLERFRT